MLFAGAGLQPAPYVFSIEERSDCKVSKIHKSKKLWIQFTKLDQHLNPVMLYIGFDCFTWLILKTKLDRVYTNSMN